MFYSLTKNELFLELLIYLLIKTDPNALWRLNLIKMCH